jgi:neopullulanase
MKLKLFICCFLAFSQLGITNNCPLSILPLKNNISTTTTTLTSVRDTFDPEQRLPEGVVKPTPGLISAKATTEPFETRVDPASWFIGFKNPTVELMIHDKNIHDFQISIIYKGLTIKKIDRPENNNYLFVTLNIAPTTVAGDVKINLIKGSDKRTIKWRLDRLNTEGGVNQGVSTKDFMYLIMPDRFANGDPSNDDVVGLSQRGIDRRKMFFRHGGDLKGISNNLDYLKDLGVTTLWLNPVQENDEPFESYHGYAMTDLYRIDRRFGSNEDYKNLVKTMHNKGMKMVMDVAPNHFGHNNYLIKDLPETNWVHQFDTFTRTTYRDQVVFDPYASEADKNRMVNGWFDFHMPDMNPQNQHLANYITQSYLWWLAYSGLDGFRVDTYLYNDPQFMANWTKRVRQEFPKLHIFGETWVTGTNNQAYSTEKVGLTKKYDSYMHGVTDFQLYFSITESLTREQGWQEGIMKIYQNLANDFIYKNPYNNVTFIDNHDIARFYSVVNEDMSKYKSAIAWLLTCRGIPQWYYGAELGFTGYTNPDGKVRQDMPGGWKEDTRSVFTEGGRTDKEKEIFNYTKKLANWRKTKPALHDGKLMQFIPVDGVYTYFRYTPTETIMVVMNTHGKKVSLDTKRFQERLKGFTKGKNAANDLIINDLGTIELDNFETKVIELMR